MDETIKVLGKRATQKEQVRKRLLQEGLILFSTLGLEKTTVADNLTQEIEEKLTIGKPISFKVSETYSFNQWLQLAAKKPIERTENITPKIRC